MKRVGVVVLVLVIGAALGAVGLVAWRARVARASLERTLTAAETSADAGRWVEVRALLEDHARRRGRPADAGPSERWTRLEFRAASGLRDFAELRALATARPLLAGTDETAAVWLWRLHAAEKDAAGAEAIRQVWRGRETLPGLWAAAAFDQAMLESGPEAAAESLRSLPTAVAQTSPMQLRAALVAGTAAERVGHIEAAYKANPRDADVRAVRAAVLERAGESGFARVEHVAALIADPTNPLRRDALASFYLRSGDIARAVETWSEGLDERSPSFMWTRALFWSRVQGVSVPARSAEMAAARPGRYEAWLAALSPDVYWDDAEYARLAVSTAHARSEPSVFWLRLLEQLRRDDWEAARALALDASPEAAAMSPRLIRSVMMVADVRAGRSLDAHGSGWPAASSELHSWWQVCGAAAAGDAAAVEQFSQIAHSPFAAQALLVAAGWTGPAVKIGDPVASATEAAPDWLRFGLLQARRVATGPQAALAWGEKLPPYPPTDYILASLRLASGREDVAVPELRRLAAAGGETGLAAGWLLATWLLERGRTDEVLQLVTATPVLATSDLGRSVQARALEVAGREAEALELHRGLSESVLESGARMARAAFAAGQYDEAERLTNFWLLKHPDNLQLRKNLEAIRVARSGGKVAP